MARIRTIKPEFWEDEKIGKLSRDCRLLFIALWNFADDFGVFRANPAVLKSKIFPFDDSLRVNEVKSWLDALSIARMILPFEYKKESYYVIRTFKSHQIIDKRYQKSLLSKDLLETQRIIDKITMCLHSVHDKNTTMEVEVEVEMEIGSGNGIEHNEKNEDCFSQKEEETQKLNGEFAKTWQRWLEYRCEIKKPYKSQKSIENQLADLKKYDEDTAIAMIEQSITCGYIGVFPLKRNNHVEKEHIRNDLTKRIYAKSNEQITGN